ncbi:MAG: biotin/lipoate protein ligase [Verrucomicrobia bacterium]|nr:biotin/lipoate protein ligase [Verrucomicrobiota bacterium]
MVLEILPVKHGTAAENMALDFLLLQGHPRPSAPRFRHYGWHRPAFTFGYAQKISFVRSSLPSGEGLDVCRRPTGGGIVDHRDDWTYSVVIPRGHPLEDVRATQSYREIHECVAGALRAQGVPAVTKQSCEPPADGATCAASGVCFQRAELHDVVHSGSGEKIAGGAQKRNKHGLLFQGSIWRPAIGAGANLDWDRFHDDLAEQLGLALRCEATPSPWPGLDDEEVSGLVEQYSSPEWIEFR